MARKRQRILDIHNKIIDVTGGTPAIPYHVWTCFWDSSPELHISDLGIMFEGDMKNTEEIRDGLGWLVNQMGGKVEWSEDES